MELIVACAWCGRVRLDGWVEPAEADRRLPPRTGSAPPLVSHGICERCFDRLVCRAPEREAA
jgi:hypothetical protein